MGRRRSRRLGLCSPLHRQTSLAVALPAQLQELHFPAERRELATQVLHSKGGRACVGRQLQPGPDRTSQPGPLRTLRVEPPPGDQTLKLQTEPNQLEPLGEGASCTEGQWKSPQPGRSPTSLS